MVLVLLLLLLMIEPWQGAKHCAVVLSALLAQAAAVAACPWLNLSCLFSCPHLVQPTPKLAAGGKQALSWRLARLVVC